MDSKNPVGGCKNKLYKSVEGAYASISPDSHMLGKIIDINPDGVCSKYIKNSGGQQTTQSYQKETISLSSPCHYVADLPFKIISDYEITDAPSFGFMKIRIRHAQFVELSSQHLFDLDRFLRKNFYYSGYNLRNI